LAEGKAEISLHKLFPQETGGNINKGVWSLECQSSELIDARAKKSNYIHRMTKAKWLTSDGEIR
jgi:hypothetical protein